MIGACGGTVIKEGDDGNTGGNSGNGGPGGGPNPGVGGVGGRTGRGGASGGSGVGGRAGYGGGASGTAGYAGAGGYAGSSSCVDQQCAPGLTCCNPNSGCAVSSTNGGGYSCTCASGRWVCSPIDVDAGGGTCGPTGCPAGLSCCNGRCVNSDNDPYNCGTCGWNCATGSTCLGGQCLPTPCSAPDASVGCCGASVCGGGELCCSVYTGGPGGPQQPACYPVSAAGTCPVGCPTCL
jgi:hypothetical protein